MTSLTTRLNLWTSRNSERLQYRLIFVWVVIMIALPIFERLFGDGIIPVMVTLALLVQAGTVFLILQSQWGWRKTAVIWAMIAVLTWGIEFVGSSTNLPFGNYHYTDALEPQIGGVPMLIPFAWFMMLPCAWAVASLIAGKHRKLAYIAASAIALTAWDLFLDPQMVAWGFWVWHYPGDYFGIPWSNYAGWLIAGAALTALIRPYRFDLPLIPLLTMYLLVWLLQSIGLGLFWEQPGPALVGTMAMGAVLFAALRRYRGQVV